MNQIKSVQLGRRIVFLSFLGTLSFSTSTYACVKASEQIIPKKEKGVSELLIKNIFTSKVVYYDDLFKKLSIDLEQKLTLDGDSDGLGSIRDVFLFFKNGKFYVFEVDGAIAKNDNPKALSKIKIFRFRIYKDTEDAGFRSYMVYKPNGVVKEENKELTLDLRDITRKHRPKPANSME